MVNGVKWSINYQVMKMDEFIAGFAKQIERAIEIGEQAELTQHPLAIHNVLVTGLGGSRHWRKHCG